MKKEIKGASNRILEVDLSSGKSSVFKVSETLRTVYLAGAVMGINLLLCLDSPCCGPGGR